MILSAILPLSILLTHCSNPVNDVADRPCPCGAGFKCSLVVDPPHGRCIPEASWDFAGGFITLDNPEIVGMKLNKREPVTIRWSYEGSKIDPRDKISILYVRDADQKLRYLKPVDPNVNDAAAINIEIGSRRFEWQAVETIEELQLVFHYGEKQGVKTLNFLRECRKNPAAGEITKLFEVVGTKECSEAEARLFEMKELNLARTDIADLSLIADLTQLEVLTVRRQLADQFAAELEKLKTNGLSSLIIACGNGASVGETWEARTIGGTARYVCTQGGSEDLTAILSCDEGFYQSADQKQCRKYCEGNRGLDETWEARVDNGHGKFTCLADGTGRFMEITSCDSGFVKSGDGQKCLEILCSNGLKPGAEWIAAIEGGKGRFVCGGDGKDLFQGIASCDDGYFESDGKCVAEAASSADGWKKIDQEIYLDSKTRLQWIKPQRKYRTWQEANSYCDSLVAQNGGGGWKLPSKEQLLEAYTHHISALKGEKELDFISYTFGFWSDSLSDNGPAAWVVDFYNGSSFAYPRGEVTSGAICVRQML
jgi:hypothetical protein